MTTRPISVRMTDAFNRATADASVILFLTLTHADLPTPIRLVRDAVDYVRGGELWTGLLFEVSLLAETDRMPTATLSIPNVDAVIGATLRVLDGPIGAAIELVAGVDFDSATQPRQEIGTAEVLYQARSLRLYGVEVKVDVVSGELRRRGTPDSEPWPLLAGTQDLLPGLYL